MTAGRGRANQEKGHAALKNTTVRRGSGIRRWIYELIEPSAGTGVAGLVFDWTITVLIFMSVVIVFLGTFDLPQGVLDVLSALETAASVVFTIEYALRILTADMKFPGCGRLSATFRYVVSPLAIIDLLSILPFLLPMLMPGTMLGIRSLRLVRLLRVFKLNRYFDATRLICDVVVSKKRELMVSVFFVSVLMLLSSLLMYSAEHTAQPEVFRNAFSGLWWAVATLTTVGYGDIYPVTALGRVLGAFIALSGIAVLAIPTGIISSGLTERISRNAEVDKELSRQRNKDAEHDRLLLEQAELLKKIADKLSIS